jgi:ArsR family transcriptional regulator
VLAFEAVAKLREHGFKARRLEDGYPEWKAAGLPVEALQDEAGKRLTTRKATDSRQSQ